MNVPDRLISNDNLAPVLSGDGLLDSRKLARHNLNRLSGLTLLKRLADTQNNTNTTLNRSRSLASDEIIRLLQNGPTLGVTGQSPRDAKVLELFDGDFAGEGTVGLVEDVLGRDGNGAVGEGFLCESEVERRRSDDDFDVGVELGAVEVGDDGLRARDGAVPGVEIELVDFD